MRENFIWATRFAIQVLFIDNILGEQILGLNKLYLVIKYFS